MLATAEADIVASQFLKVEAGISLNLFQHNGLGAAALGVGAVAYDPVGLTLRLAAQHQQWNDWQAGENRLLATLTAEPAAGLRLATGLVWRAPVFDAERYGSPFYWCTEVPERNLLYRVEWGFVRREQWQASGWLANFDRFTVHNPQQIPFGLRGAYNLGREWNLLGRCGTAINGLSGLILSLGEVAVEMGVQREF